MNSLANISINFDWVAIIGWILTVFLFSYQLTKGSINNARDHRQASALSNCDILYNEVVEVLNKNNLEDVYYKSEKKEIDNVNELLDKVNDFNAAFRFLYKNKKTVLFGTGQLKRYEKLLIKVKYILENITLKDTKPNGFNNVKLSIEGISINLEDLKKEGSNE